MQIFPVPALDKNSVSQKFSNNGSLNLGHVSLLKRKNKEIVYLVDVFSYFSFLLLLVNGSIQVGGSLLN